MTEEEQEEEEEEQPKYIQEFDWEYYDTVTEDWPIQEHEIIKQEELPKLVKDWVDTFLQVSRHNEFPAILSYFTMLGQVVKDMVQIPYGYVSEDTRIHVCWIQNARSGKSVLNDFLSEIANETWDLIEEYSGDIFTTFDIIEFTDAALVANYKEVPNPDFGREEDEAETKYVEVEGAIEGSGLLLFDEFESSGIFKNMPNKASMITYFQRLMNSFTTDGYLIKKVLTGKPTCTTRCQRSVWATTYPPEQLNKTIAEKGVLQRMFLYVRVVPEEIRNKMKGSIISGLGTVKKRNMPVNKYANSFLTIFQETKARFDLLSSDFEDRMALIPEKDRYNCPQEEMMIWSEGAKELMQIEYDNMIEFMRLHAEGIKDVVSLFETNFLLYMAKIAVLCVITENPSRREDEKWVILERNMRQSTSVVRQGYMSLVAWMLTAHRVKRQSVAESSGLSDAINAYHTMDPSKVKDGWVSKTEYKLYMETQYQIPHASFHRLWPNISFKFEHKKEGRTVLIKLKEEQE